MTNKTRKGKQFILSFVGKKEELQKQLKIWCVRFDQTMNGKVIELIEEFLKTKK